MIELYRRPGSPLGLLPHLSAGLVSMRTAVLLATTAADSLGRTFRSLSPSYYWSWREGPERLSRRRARRLRGRARGHRLTRLYSGSGASARPRTSASCSDS